ncbi:MAG: hypothetical protein FJ087_00255 [Deltaproteobacteria bacterium]|nr:hypothetical protein [Deltaproteobacteria bacterium]
MSRGATAARPAVMKGRPCAGGGLPEGIVRAGCAVPEPVPVPEPVSVPEPEPEPVPVPDSPPPGTTPRHLAVVCFAARERPT